MAKAPTTSTWARLRANKPLHDDFLALETSGNMLEGRDIFFGSDRRSDLHLLIPVNGESPGDMPQDLQGLRVRHRILERHGNYLDLIATAAHERLFSTLILDVLTAVVDQNREPWKAVNSIIRAWQSAWRPTIPVLSKTAQVGLFGELLTLEKIMIPALGPEAIHIWSGPNSERHDFVSARLNMEVKTTRKSRHEHEISRFDQLDVPEGRKLILVSILLEESIAGTESVATKLDDIIDLIRSDPAASDEFMAKMVQLGWTDELRRTGQLLHFHIRGAHIYEVNDHFPRLPTNFIIPEGVVAIKYTIDLSNLPFLGVDDAIDAAKHLINTT